jgi:pyruvate-formate lyase
MNKMDYENALRFTDVFRLHEHDHPAVREAHCLRAQFPSVLTPIADDDLFAGAGGLALGFVGFLHGSSNGQVGYFCDEARIKGLIESDTITSEERVMLSDLLEFWQTRTSFAAASRAIEALGPLTPEMSRAIYTCIPNKPEPCYLGCIGPRVAGINLDFDKLLLTGIPGLQQEIKTIRQAELSNHGDTSLFDAMTMALDLLSDICRWYSAQARQMASDSSSEDGKRCLIDMANVLDRIATARPASFREAVQLWCLYTVLSGTDNFGRMDVYLGDFLVHDLDSGTLSENQAREIFRALWLFMLKAMPGFTSRIILGGIGRRNERNADRFAMLALMTTQELRSPTPQLSLRIYDGLDRRLYDKALDMIGDGCTFPILYNDNALVPSIAKSFHVSIKEAQQYVVSDCGEHHLEHRSLNSPNGNLSLAKALDLVIHNGYCTITKNCVGLATGDFRKFRTFDDLWKAYTAQVEAAMAVICDRQAVLYETMSAQAPFLFESILYDECIARNKGLFAGGARYKGILTEIYGTITAADSLFAIKKVVFDKKIVTPEKLLAMLDADFIGYEHEHQIFRNLPKYGNDIDSVDSMAQNVHNHICRAANAHAKRLGLDWSLVDLINVNGNVLLGKNVGATPDGRKALQPLNNANNPVAGKDVSGATALLNSLVKLDASNVGGQVQHFMCSRELFSPELRPRLTALLDTYFANDGIQLMITTVNRDDLENAMKEPEKYQNLMVRIGGFSARFVTLDIELQRDIVARTIN